MFSSHKEISATLSESKKSPSPITISITQDNVLNSVSYGDNCMIINGRQISYDDPNLKTYLKQVMECGLRGETFKFEEPMQTVLPNDRVDVGTEQQTSSYSSSDSESEQTSSYSSSDSESEQTTISRRRY